MNRAVVNGESNCSELNILEDFIACGMLALGSQVEVLNQTYF